MNDRHSDGSAGDANYGLIGKTYRRYRLPEPAFARAIIAALGDAETVLNVGAGAGSYEPSDRKVTAVEPSATMRAQRPAHLTQAIDAYSEALPFDDKSFDAALASFTVHQWSDLEKGLSEMRRVTKGPIVILTCAPDQVQKFWLNDYAPLVMATEARRYPAFDRMQRALGHLEARPLAIPFACVDGFNEAYYGRPEMLLDPGAREANSAWSFVPADVSAGYVVTLEQALKSGAWDAKYGGLRTAPTLHGSLHLLVATL
jgi:SAM-dependent methyltransferase